MKEIKVGNKSIGEHSPCFVVAEIGINHNGDIELAKDVVTAAKEAGADAVKFQNYKTEDFIIDKSITHKYINNDKEIEEIQHEMFKRYELDFDDLSEISAFCDKNEIIFFSTPTGLDSLKDLLSLNVQLLKNGSDLLSNIPLIKKMGETGLPTVISTGMSYLSEIDLAVREFFKTGNENLILLLCTSVYPTAQDEVNLKKINSLRNTFNCLVGFSDHTQGNTAAIGSIVYGSCFLEKHFTLDKKLSGPDHEMSADPEEFKKLVDDVRNIEANIGNSTLVPAKSEISSKFNFTLSCVAKNDLPENHLLEESDISYSRPGSGIPPAHSYLLNGRKLKAAVKKVIFLI